MLASQALHVNVHLRTAWTMLVTQRCGYVGVWKMCVTVMRAKCVCDACDACKMCVTVKRVKCA